MPKMVFKCCLCRRMANKVKNIYLHKFPDNKGKTAQVFEQWLSICGISINRYSSGIRICSLHFRENDLIIIGNKKKPKLMAIPTIKVPNPQTSMQIQQEKNTSEEQIFQKTNGIQVQKNVTQSTAQQIMLEKLDPVKIGVIQNDSEIQGPDSQLQKNYANIQNENNASEVHQILTISTVDEDTLDKISKVTSAVEELSKSGDCSIVIKDLSTRNDLDEFDKLLEHYTNMGITCSVFMIPKISMAVKKAEAINDDVLPQNNISEEDMQFEMIEENAFDNEFLDAENTEPSSPLPKTRHCYYPRFISEIEMSDFECPKKTEIVLNFVKSDDKEKLLKIENLQCENMLLKKCIESMSKLKKSG